MNIHRCRFVDYTPHSISSLEFSTPSTKSVASHDLRLAVGRSNGDIEIWNPRWSWIHEMTLKGGKGRSVEGLGWSSWGDDRSLRLFSIGGSTSITEWDLKTGMPLVNHDCHSGVIWSLAISEDGTKLAVGCDNGTVVIADISGGPGVIEHYKILQRHSARIMSLAWKGNNQIVGGCSDARIRIWSITSGDNGAIVSTMRVDKAKREDTMVWSVKILKNKQIVSGDSTGSVKFWNGSNFSLLQSFKVHEADVLCLASDLNGDTVFSSGVDRKIISYKIIDSKLKRWANVSSRLLHSHDIRAMATFESKGANFLVSGGVERTIVINSVRDFTDGVFRKIPITRHRPCVSVAAEPKYVLLWTDQIVKIWKIDEYSDDGNDEKDKKLVAKLTLGNEENIVYAAISEDGSKLAVSTLVETKLFGLSPSETADGRFKLEVEKLESELSDLGAYLLRFLDNKLIMITPESDVIVYNIESKSFKEIETSTTSSKPKLDYYNNINQLTVSGKHFAIARWNGQVDLCDITGKSHQLIKLSSPATALSFTPSQSLIVVTAENKVLEFDLDTRALSSWSRRNSDLLPEEFISLVDKCCGVFCEPSSTAKRVWLWGANWLCFINLNVNIVTERAPKRKFDRLGVPLENGEEKFKRKIEYEVSRSALSISSPINNDDDKGSLPFWITHKYRPMLLADSFGQGEFVVIERPPFNIPLPPAFWSNHKIRI